MEKCGGLNSASSQAPTECLLVLITASEMWDKKGKTKVRKLVSGDKGSLIGEGKIGGKLQEK